MLGRERTGDHCSALRRVRATLGHPAEGLAALPGETNPGGSDAGRSSDPAPGQRRVLEGSRCRLSIRQKAEISARCSDTVFPLEAAAVAQQAADDQVDGAVRDLFHGPPVHPRLVTHDQMQGHDSVNAAPDDLGEEVWIFLILAKQPGGDRFGQGWRTKA